MNAIPGTAANHPMASLYVGNLHPDVTEAFLFEKFSTVGKVSSIRVCRDFITDYSLGYAYVNFQQPQDAERALETMNFDTIKGKHISIMRSQGDSSLRKSGVGTIFIKNLDKSIDNKALYDTFSAFGCILSCKIAMDENGSKCYGFVHFETEEAATSAIEKVNGMLLNGKKVFVGRFMSRKERLEILDDKARNFTSVSIKNLPASVDDDKLREMFDIYGTVNSAKVMQKYCDGDSGRSNGFGCVLFEDHEDAARAVDEMNGKNIEGRDIYVGSAQKKAEHQDLNKKFEIRKLEWMNRYQTVNLYVKNLDDGIDDEKLRGMFEIYGKIISAKVMQTDCDGDGGRSKGFGFVCFCTPEDAARAVDELNGKNIDGREIYVGLAQKKAKRQADIKEKFERLKLERMNRYQVNLYVKNLDDGIDDERLRNEFSQFGTITSAKVMVDGGGSKGFGFVCFSSAEEATKAMTEMNGRIILSKQLYVTLAQRKEDRKANLEEQYMQRMAGLLMQGQTAEEAKVEEAVAALQTRQAQEATPCWNAPQAVRQHQTQAAAGFQAMPQYHMRQPRPVFGQQQVRAAITATRPITGQQTANTSMPLQMPRGQGAMPKGARPNYKYTATMRNPPQPAVAQTHKYVPQAIYVQGQKPLTASMLAAAPLQEQKQMLGERLFPRIQAIYPVLAGTIVGLLLEIDNSELLHMLESRESLKAKVEEAVAVLQNDPAYETA